MLYNPNSLDTLINIESKILSIQNLTTGPFPPPLESGQDQDTAK